MMGKGWSKRSYGCAVSGESCLAVNVRYHVSERRLHVEQAWSGNLSDRGFVSRLTRALGRKPLWIPLDFASDSERSDVKVCVIDDDEGRIRGNRLNDAVVSQLQSVEANKAGDYIRTHTRFMLEGKRSHIVGASVPRASLNKSLEFWSGKGVLNPCVGSTRAALVNLFLALHPAASAAEPVHRLLAHRAPDSDMFCYLQGKAFMDSGASPWVVGGFDTMLDHLGAWGGDFAQKYRLTQTDQVKAYVMGAEPVPSDQSFSDTSIEFWTVPWGETVTFAAGPVEKAVLGQRSLAFSALGLALHGV